MLKITIEEEGKEPEVLENIEQYVLVADDGKGHEVLMNCNEQFLGFAASRIQHAFGMVIVDVEEFVPEETLS